MKKNCKAFQLVIFFMIFLIVKLSFTTTCSFAEITPNQGKQLKKHNKILYGQASFYANKFVGRKTANGEIFSQEKLTAACNVLPLGTWVKVTNLKNKKVVVVKTNDRLHPNTRRLIDLTKAAARKLGFVKHGLTRVKIEILPNKI